METSMLTKFKSLLVVLSLALSFNSFADEYSPGNGYTVISNPVPVVADGKIHVEEAFWYGCPHCFQLESLLTPWKKTVADDRSEEHTSELQSRPHLVCRLLLEKKNSQSTSTTWQKSPSITA